jgi:hypothetical protein
MNDVLIYHYVRIWYHGLIASEHVVRHIPNREDFNCPPEAFGYQFFDKRIVELPSDTLEGKVDLNETKQYIKGKLVSLEEAMILQGNSILVQNMKGNKWDYVIRSGDRYYPYDSTFQEII